MRILIAEDEPVSARRLAEVTRKILGNKIVTLHIEKDFNSACKYLETNHVDLLLLDLTLAAQDGFNLLQSISKNKFSTIIVSGYTERAIEAFKYEVLDFVPKPFEEERLALALSRYTRKFFNNPEKSQLAITEEGKHIFLFHNDIAWATAKGKISQIHKLNGSKHLYKKTLGELHSQLGENFLRIHKSFLIQRSKIQEIEIGKGGKYFIILNTGDRIPLSRTVYKKLISKI